MCTAIKIYSDNGDIYFGRTMDFSFELNPELYYIRSRQSRAMHWRISGGRNGRDDIGNVSKIPALKSGYSR